jgi:branched-chain amino acid transport system ATP-binding protein
MGKTTLMRSLMGLAPPRSGSIQFGGRELVGLAPYKIAQRGLALVPQGRRIFPSLSVEENLTLGFRKAQENGDGEAGTKRWTVERVYDLFPQLKDRRGNRGNELSGGEQQMLAIGRALMTNPRLLLMDEPSEGLAPVLIARVSEVIAALGAEKMTILLVEQNYRLGVDSADHIYILSKGVVVWEGTPHELDEAEQIRHMHLGV